MFGLALLSITSIAAGTLAAGAAAGADAPKADKAATLELMRTIVPPAAYDAMLAIMYQQMSATMQQMGGKGIPASKQKALKEAVQECLTYDDLLNWSADVYTKHFTRKEIEDIAAFYKTPTGKKIASKLPELTGEVGAKVTPVLMTRLPAAMKKRGLQ